MNQYELTEARTIRSRCRYTLWCINQQKQKKLYDHNDEEFELLLEEIVDRLAQYKSGPDKCPYHKTILKDDICRNCISSPFVVS